MKKSRNSFQSKRSVKEIMRQFASMSASDFENQHGVEFMDDGEVYDPVYNRSFASVKEWAEFSIEMDEMETGEHFKYGNDGEDY